LTGGDHVDDGRPVIRERIDEGLLQTAGLLDPPAENVHRLRRGGKVPG
jgi:hypothetical protein